MEREMADSTAPVRLSYEALLELKRWNTPSVYNGWEVITKKNRAKGHFNLEETRDYMPQMGPMVGYAVTVVIEPSNPSHPKVNPNVWSEYRRYIAAAPGPKIVVVQDLDKPNFVGAYWGEVNSNTHRALGCVGTIIDGVIRDVDEMCNAGFKAIAKRTSVGHAYSVPVRWNCDVEVFGCTVKSGQLIHADKHGFLVVPEEDEAALLDACRFMDANECRTLIPAARATAGKTMDEILRGMDEAGRRFGDAVKKKFGAKGEG
jgi:4-hydroxy-4-methyl-2-oxoglutarate aldolase